MVENIPVCHSLIPNELRSSFLIDGIYSHYQCKNLSLWFENQALQQSQKLVEHKFLVKLVFLSESASLYIRHTGTFTNNCVTGLIYWTVENQIFHESIHVFLILSLRVKWKFQHIDNIWHTIWAILLATFFVQIDSFQWDISNKVEECSWSPMLREVFGSWQ